MPVLYVDDEPALLDVGKFFLEETSEFTVVTASSASVALDRLKSNDIKAIVSDYQMPGIDGIEFLKQVRAKDKAIPFILFTGRGREEIAIQAFENGADYYLQKGGDPTSQFAELTHKIKRAVDHIRDETQVATLNRLYSVLSASNKAIVHIYDKKELLTEICRIVVDIGGFAMAWAGIVNEKTHIIEPVSACGHGDHYLDNISISTDDIPRGQGPTGTAFRTGKFSVSNDIEHDPKMAPWRKGALDRGYRSLAAFPFALDSKNAGVITFYASEPGFFNDQIIRLLEEQSGDISFALITLDHEEKRRAAENDLKKSELQYRRLFETAQDAILILNGVSGEIIDANKFIIDMLGYPLEYFKGKHLWELGFLKDKTLAQDAFLKLKTDGYIRYEDIPLETKQGREMRVEFVSNVYLVDDKPIIQCNIRDITERKQTEDALRESENRYRDTFDLNNAVMLIVNPETGSIVDANSAASRYYGYSHEEFSRLKIMDINIAKPSTIKSDMSAALGNHGELFTFRHRKKSGEIRTVEVFSGPIMFDGKQFLHSIIHDVTERNRAEVALKESEKKYRTLFEQMLEGFAYCQMIYDEKGQPADWVYLNVNAAFESITGLENITGKRVLEVIPDIRKQTPELFDIYGRVASSGIPETFEINFKPLTLWLRISVFSPEKGYFVAIFEDITVRKRTDERLNHLAAIVTSSENAIIGKTLEGIITSWNASAERIYGYTASETIGKPISMLVPPGERDEIPMILEKIRAGETIRSFETKRMAKDGRIINVSLIVSPIKNDKGIITGASTIGQDITERKHAENALALANRKLNLLSGITRHDILNQLTALKTYIELSKDMQDKETLAKYISTEEKIADTLERQINFTREYQDLGVTVPVWQNVRVCIEKAVASLPIRDVTVKMDFVDCEIFADLLFDKVFYNLIDNALKYGGNTMTFIRISSFVSGKGITLVCEDNGAGISEDDKKHLFTRGFGKHTGLGLFLSREILSITGITIIENGEAGKGARFEITVPKENYRVVDLTVKT
ncbi:MAG: PAS domain S-box protein [Methanoregula sp.]